MSALSESERDLLGPFVWGAWIGVASGKEAAYSRDLFAVVEQIATAHAEQRLAAFRAEAVAAIEAEADVLTEVGSVLCEFYGINCRHCETPNQAVMQPAGEHLKAVAQLIRRLDP